MSLNQGRTKESFQCTLIESNIYQVIVFILPDNIFILLWNLIVNRGQDFIFYLRTSDLIYNFSFK